MYERLTNRTDIAATSAATTALMSILPKEYAKRGIVIVDVPRRARDTIQLENIRILGDPEAGEEVNNRSLQQASPLVSKLHEEFLNEVKKSRVFIHPAAYLELKRESKLDAAREAVRTALSSKLE